MAKTHQSELNPDVSGSFTKVESLVAADYEGIFEKLAKNINVGDEEGQGRGRGRGRGRSVVVVMVMTIFW